VEEFFNPAHLIETFKKFLLDEGKEERIRCYILRLLKVRVILDYCFIRSSEDGYSLEMISENNKDENSGEGKDEDKQTLLMFESMLFVSSSTTTYYKWFCGFMDFIMNVINSHKLFPSTRGLFEALKNIDDGDVLHKLPSREDLNYQKVDRYWFWRLDFYIWKGREELFKDVKDSERCLNIAKKYRFSRNRSIEHVAPQNPEPYSDLQWKDTDEDKFIRDSFGNLVMISGGLNSSLKNLPYEQKRARVEAYIKGKLTDSIQSLSLLLLFAKYDSWDKDKISKYGELTYDILKKSYHNSNSNT